MGYHNIHSRSKDSMDGPNKDNREDEIFHSRGMGNSQTCITLYLFSQC